MSHARRLSQLSNEWNQAEAVETGRTPDGTYIVRIEKATIEESQFGNLFLNIDTIIVSGEYEGWHVFYNRNLEDPKQFPYLKSDFKKMTIEVDDLAQLEFVLRSMRDVHLEVKVTTKQVDKNGEKKEYRNTYIQKRVDMQPKDPFQDDGKPVDISDDDLPF